MKQFRKIATGDRLRAQYQMLTNDPNSLSNLDQDLPNNMIHDIPIFSLPQEWLIYFIKGYGARLGVAMKN